MKSQNIQRNDEIKVLLDIIKNREMYKENSENGLVILLNGSWGSGKTTFLNQFKEKIKDEENINLFADYNSYEYDFYENAYLPFFAEIEGKIDLKKDFGKLIKCINNPLFNTLTTAYAILNHLKKKDIINLKDIKNDIIEIKNEEILSDFKEIKDLKRKIKQSMEEYCKDKAQVFIIDELDRCKPTFAMETLEIVKHFFDIKNCVFIISVDKLQLQESVKTIYGQKMDSEKYFSKFFDYHFNLYPLTFTEIIDELFDIENSEEIIVKSNEIFECLSISLRDSKKIFINFVSKYKKLSSEGVFLSEEQSIFIVFLFTLKYTDLLFYEQLLNGSFNSFKNKIMNDNNISSFGYKRLLDMKIGSTSEIYNNICEKLSKQANKEYISEENPKYISLSEPNIDESLKKIAKVLSNYIPYIRKGLTYQETIRNIIN